MIYYLRLQAPNLTIGHIDGCGNNAAMSQFTFISCDIVGHSAEPEVPLQVERIRGINRIIDQFLDVKDARAVIWASGGDGGHVAFAHPDRIHTALRLIFQLRAWSREAKVRLRIVANCGDADWIEGAGGIIQLVGPGINLAGRLLEYGDQDRVVATEQFAKRVEAAGISGVMFHDERTLVPKYFPPQKTMLLSIEGDIRSKWNDNELDERSQLDEALRSERSWDVIYHSRRLMEVNGHDQDAIAGLVTLAEQGLAYEHDTSREMRLNPLLGPMDRYSRVDFIRSAQLIEREKGEILCRYQDGGDTMFVILRGEIAVLPGDIALELLDTKQTPLIRIGVGAIVGELAFALHRKRTATLRCLTRTALLSFSPQAVEMVSSGSPAGATIRQAMDRFVKMRVLEHLCNNTNYLIGRTRAGPLKDIREPWVLLVDNTTLIRFPSVTKRSISRQDKELRGRGIYILVSGELRDTSRADCFLSGTDLPIVFADFPGDIQTALRTYHVILDAIIVRIAPEAFTNAFIPPKTFSDFLQAVGAANYEAERAVMIAKSTHQKRNEVDRKIKILFLAANPASTNVLQLDREAREIEEKLRGTRERDKLELVTKWAVRADDLQQYLLEHQPHVVHFSGHGSETNELILEDKSGKPKPLSQVALIALFRAIKDNIRVVVLNACFSQEQAAAITETIDCAIGMNREIGDQAAVTFAASLYRAFGYGRSVQTAFDLGTASLLAEGIPEDRTPVLLANPNANVATMVLVD